jgi:hypothetical protein
MREKYDVLEIQQINSHMHPNTAGQRPLLQFNVYLDNSQWQITNNIQTITILNKDYIITKINSTILLSCI